MKVLLIEDHAFQRQIMATQLAQLLTELGDEIQTASSGVDALTLMSGYSPDLLLCDLNMPEMDGITFLSRVAEQAFQGSVVITSATSQDVIRSVSKMCADYQLNLLGALTKPVQLETLSSMIKQARDAKPQALHQHPVTTVNKNIIEQAFNQHWFVPYLQPIVDISTGAWTSSEALMRLLHPQLGLINPSEFIPLIRQLEKDADLALYTLHYVITNASLLQGKRVAINISSATLSTPGFVDEVLQLAHRHPHLHHTVYFELTESDMVKNTGRALESASRLGMNGFTLSIDDFGTGFSSLKQLETLPFESLKIDMGFTKAIATSDTALAIVESCLFLSNRLSLTSIVEGVENIQIWQQLQMLNGQLAQGYFIAAPMPTNKLNQWHIQWQQKVTELQLRRRSDRQYGE
ncbi:EAL domain-containing response regulator [Photobacterium kagoshimensis]|uniref:EAL domain-containing response regulator n=1 Tax=Photobacterium kagoshimensis TaxID=2910242 RepID=UPI003D12BE0F